MNRAGCGVRAWSLFIATMSAGLVAPAAVRGQSCDGATLTNDDRCEVGCALNQCACFVEGEMAAVQLQAPAHWYPLQILEVHIFWGSFTNNGQPTVADSIRIFKGNTFPDPGPQIAVLEGPQLTEGFLNAFVLEQFLPNDVIIESGKFSIALEFADNNVNDFFAGTVFSDRRVQNGGNGCTPGKNMIFALPAPGGISPGWHDACNLGGGVGVSGDWLIRAVVRCIDGDQIRTLTVTSDPTGSLVNTGDSFMATPFDLTLLEGQARVLTAFSFSGDGQPFVRWDVDGVFNSNSQTIEVTMNTGVDRTAHAVYGAAGSPPEIVHIEGLPGQTRPHSGYIDPRGESTNGVTQNMGISQATVVFSEAVRNIGGQALSAAAFSVTTTGGAAPTVMSINTSANPTVVVNLSGPIPVRQWTTIRAAVEDLAGNDIPNEGNLGFSDEKDRVDIGFLPMDTTQSGLTAPEDMIRFRQILAAEPGGTVHGLGLATDFADVDRNGLIQPVDLIRFRQGLVGTPPSTQAWLSKNLPSRP
ncbi:MAG: hypothetical protein HOP29_02515 [Phycisphaerales bacterium]|nr:hypothetical protein [Phycisphaerales bacterium]